MSPEQLDRIKGYVKVIDNAASDASANALLEYCINEKCHFTWRFYKNAVSGTSRKEAC